MALALIPATIYVAVLVPDLTLAGALLLLLCEIVVVAATTTLWVAAITAVASFLLTNWFLVPPYRTLFVASTDDVIVLLTFLGSAVLASLAVTATLRSQRASALAQIEAVQLRESVSTPAAQVQPGAILQRIAQIYGLTDVALVDGEGRTLTRVATDITADTTVPVEVELADDHRLMGHGVPSIGQDPQLMMSMGNAALRGMEARGLAQEAARAAELESLDRDRSALLASVGHDLRTPITTITLAASTLASDLPVPPATRAELTETIVEAAHRLDRLVTDLLDMSRLEAGQVVAHVSPTPIDEVAAAALLSLGSPDVSLDIPEGLPLVAVDPGLLERVLANLVANALRHGLPPVAVRARRSPDGVVVDVEDHGLGLPDIEREHLFEPFTTSGDRAPGGLGLGLAIAARFCDSMGATLTPEVTSGGGLTMRVRLDVAR